MPSSKPHIQFEHSLIEDPAPAKTAPSPTPPTRAPTPAATPRAARPVHGRFLWIDPRWRYSILGILLVALAIGLYLGLRPVPQPDFVEAPMDEVLNYALLTEEFNRLPVEKRLDLIRLLIDRIKGMSADDSALMAMFAAGIDTDKLREQLMKNATVLALDLWDRYAVDYARVPTDQRDKYLDQAFLDFTKLMESVAGVTSNKSDEERLKEARDQAKRDQDMMSAGRGPTAGQLARMGDFLRNGMGQHASPQQQQRGQQLMRDMTRHLRGQDVTTGKPQRN